MQTFSGSFKVDWYDTDGMGIVHYTNYFKYFERTEHLLLDTAGIDFTKLHDGMNVSIPRVELHCNYRYPLRYRQDVRVMLWIEQMKEKSFRYVFQIYNMTEDKLAAEGWVTVIAIDLKQFKARELPKELRDGLLPFVKTE